MSATPDSTLGDWSRTIADLRRELAECKAERDAALAREAATAEVLQVINSRPATSRPCSARCSTGRYVYARRPMVTSSPTTVNVFTPPQPAAIRVTSNGRGRPVPYGRIRTLHWGESNTVSGSSMLPISGKKKFIVLSQRFGNRPS